MDELRGHDPCADRKTRRSRFERVADEVKLTPAQQLGIGGFMHPRVEEIADTLPPGRRRWLLETGWVRAFVSRFTGKGRIVRTSSLSGCLLLYLVAARRGAQQLQDVSRAALADDSGEALDKLIAHAAG